MIPICPVWVLPSVFQNWLDPSKEIKKQMRSECLFQGAGMMNVVIFNNKVMKLTVLAYELMQLSMLIWLISYHNLYKFPQHRHHCFDWLPTLIVIFPETLHGTLPSLSNSIHRTPPSSQRILPGMIRLYHTHPLTILTTETLMAGLSDASQNY